MKIKGLASIIQRELCRNHMKLVAEEETRAAIIYANIGQIWPSMIAIGLYLRAFREKMDINMIVYMVALIIMIIAYIVDTKFRKVSQKNYPYKKAYRISYLLFIATIIVGMIVMLFVMYTNIRYLENEFKELSLLLVVMVAFLLLAQYLLFSIIPTVLHFWRLKK